MRKISSKFTFLYKRIFPVVLFGPLGLTLVFTLFRGGSKVDPMLLVFTIGFAAFGYFFLKKVAWNLVDEVYDGGEYLLVKNRGQEDKIPLSEIVNVNWVTATDPHRITLRLVSPRKFGDEISFSPVQGFAIGPLAKNKIAEDLIVRVDRARSRRTI